MTSPFEPPDDSPIDPNQANPYPAPLPSGPYQVPYGAAYPPAPGYPGPYAAPWDTGRPTGIVAASVLAYVDAGLLILAGLVLLAGASAVDSWNNAFGSHHSSISTEITVDGMINLLSATLQIAGGVLITDRSERGRILLSVGGGLCIAAGAYWVIRIHDLGAFSAWAVVFVSLPIVGLALAWTRPATVWLRGHDPRQVPPRR